MANDTPPKLTAHTWRNVTVLVAAQSILGAQLPMIFIVGGLAGQNLAPTPWLSTLPISLIVFGSMTTAPWLSVFMQNYGRRLGFVLGAISGALGALISAWGLWTDSFALFLFGSYLTGIYMSAHGFYRFAATDQAAAHQKAKAISYVLAGGLIAAIIGPELVKQTSEALFLPFLGTYLAVAALNIGGLFLFFGLKERPQNPETPLDTAESGRSRSELLSDPTILVAMICAMVSYALMNLVMTSTPLAVVGCGFGTGEAADIVRAHVIAMYAPAFVTGHLIVRFGVARIVWTGLALLALAAVVALSGVALTQFFGALILLGVGWNFAFIGATTMLAQAHGPEESGRVQGMNDALVFGLVTVASLASGTLMHTGGSAEAGWAAVNIAMVPFLTLAGGALIWIQFRPRTA